MSGYNDVCEYTGITSTINLFMSFLNRFDLYEFYDLTTKTTFYS
jgi:hypothetical protein